MKYDNVDDAELDMFEKLTKYLPIPGKPDDTPGNLDHFSEIESRLSVALPDDYKQFIVTYGTGWIGDTILIFNPFSSKEQFNLLNQINRVKNHKILLPEGFSVYPNDKGVLPLGYIQDNGSIFWHVKNGNPNDWAIVLQQTRSSYFETYEMTLSKFLLNLVTNSEGSILRKSKIIGVDDFDSNLLFIPHSIAT